MKLIKLVRKDGFEKMEMVERDEPILRFVDAHELPENFSDVKPEVRVRNYKRLDLFNTGFNYQLYFEM